MKKLIIILSLILIGFISQAQSLIVYGDTKAEVADSVNANLLELFYYTDSSLVTVFDTLTDTHASVQLVALQTPLDSLAAVFGITLSDSLYFGQNGPRWRLAINTIFQELYTYMEANPIGGSDGYFFTRAGEAILDRNNKYIIVR